MGGRAGEASVFPAEGPAGFDPARPYADPAAAFAQREHVVREKLVKVETAKVRRRERCATALPRGRCNARARLAIVCRCLNDWDVPPAADLAPARAAVLPHGRREPLRELPRGAAWILWRAHRGFRASK
jgi:hypothetical protein